MMIEIERKPYDSTRMFSVIRNIHRSKSKSKLLIKNDKGMLTSDEKDQSNIIAEHFQKLFYKQTDSFKITKPKEISQPFF